jgi:hypothetical protein
MVGLARDIADRAMYQAVSHRLITAEDQFSSRSVHLGFVVDEVSLVQFFFFHNISVFLLSVSFHQHSILIHLPAINSV